MIFFQDILAKDMHKRQHPIPGADYNKKVVKDAQLF